MRHLVRQYLVATGLLLTVASQAPAQPALPRPLPRETVTDLGHGIYCITGQGGNTTLATGDDAAIVVDTQFAPVYDQLKSAIGAITSHPVRFVINTHFHNDHTFGNERFGADGAIIVAQENAAQRMQTPPNHPDGTPGTPIKPVGLPSITYSREMRVRIAGVTADLFHPQNNAHTDGDSIIVFREANVISTGDLFETRSYPIIDVWVGGSIDGAIAAVDQIYALADDSTKIIPGHGAVSDKKGLLEYRNMLQSARDRIARAKASGMTEQQVLSAHLLQDLDKRWLPPGTSQPDNFPMTVYRSLP